MGTVVVNVKTDPYDIFIGRPSRWGNPFRMGVDGTREEVIRKYQEWLEGQEILLRDLHHLKGRRLGCFCKPLACHGDILAGLAEWLV